MPNPTTYEKIKGFALSAVELKSMTNWADPVIEEFLNMIRALITIAELLDIEIDQKIEEIPTDFIDGSIPYADNGFLVEDNLRLAWDSLLSILTIGGIVSSQGRRKNITRVATTPYDILASDEIVMIDTDLVPIVTNLPAGAEGQTHKIINCGTTGNNVTINPNGLDLLNAINGPETLYNAESLDISYDPTEGWF